ncbi:aldo/keto reductase [Ktedonobacter robiniae]|uniref:NADP-dependent oxidoreductase domain-containing protein n=1 Tax=Ktedonobacter robiniae TaxID=2778365 RepID=A0ABQ3V534_9CHLR|nr:aldo/keto reductase [Ktedonobacter robiniae]GHO59705.1 hypothetical protein KSB_81800 [Ktedonobacter robiniae]
MDIKRSGSQPSGKGPAEYFTGTVRIDPLFEAPEPARVVGASVTFEPGARTAIGAQKQATPAQIALAWLLAQKPWIVPIPGSRKIERLEENIGVVNVDLSEGDLREIESAMSNITVLGDRY